MSLLLIALIILSPFSRGIYDRYRPTCIRRRGGFDHARN